MGNAKLALMDSLTPFNAALAFVQILEGKPEYAEGWLAKIPRSDRGAVRIALEDMSITLEHLGRRVVGSYACEVLIELRRLRTALHSDRFLDLVLDELTERAGHDRNTDALALARWDLKAAIDSALEHVI